MARICYVRPTDGRIDTPSVCPPPQMQRRPLIFFSFFFCYHGTANYNNNNNMSPPDADADGAQAPPSASAEEMRKLLKPNPSEGEVLAALSRTYPTMNLNIVRELESYDDKNYLVQDAANDGTKYLAKIHNGVESLDYINKISSPNCRTSVIDLQNAIFSHLTS